MAESYNNHEYEWETLNYDIYFAFGAILHALKFIAANSNDNPRIW